MNHTGMNLTGMNLTVLNSKRRKTTGSALLLTLAATSIAMTGTPAAIAQSASHKSMKAWHYDPAMVDQHILRMHQALAITPAEEGLWNNVANVIRGNAKAMGQAMKQRQAMMARQTASENLFSYAATAQTHAQNMNNFATSFETLYRAMPAAQQRNADQFFRTGGRHM